MFRDIGPRRRLFPTYVPSEFSNRKGCTCLESRLQELVGFYLLTAAMPSAFLIHPRRRSLPLELSFRVKRSDTGECAIAPREGPLLSLSVKCARSICGSAHRPPRPNKSIWHLSSLERRTNVPDTCFDQLGQVRAWDAEPPALSAPTCRHANHSIWSSSLISESQRAPCQYHLLRITEHAYS